MTANKSLNLTSIFDLSDCGCDVGGSVTKACNKETGQCICQPRITGRTCKEPLQTHYFPTLHQFLYEVEDGITPDKTPIRYKYDEDIFPGYSWKGYAVFSPIQVPYGISFRLRQCEKYFFYRFFFQFSLLVFKLHPLKWDSGIYCSLLCKKIIDYKFLNYFPLKIVFLMDQLNTILKLVLSNLYGVLFLLFI